MEITYANLYDQLVPLLENELSFYGNVLQTRLSPGESVLVTPSTTGRVCITLAELGFKVTGVDLDPEMTAVAQKKKAQLPAELQALLSFKTGDMCRINRPDHPFGAVVVPERGLLCLDRRAREQAMAGFHQLLRFAGTLVFDVSLKREAPLFDYNTEFPAPWAAGHKLRVKETVEAGGSNGHVVQRITAQELDGNRPVQSQQINLGLHFPDKGEVVKLLMQYGFNAWSLYGDFDRRNGQDAGDYEIWVACRT